MLTLCNTEEIVEAARQEVELPPAILPPKPKLMKPATSLPPPPPLPPPQDQLEEEIYDEGAPEDLGYMEDVYDDPSEIVEEQIKHPAAPPPPSSPPREPSPDPIEEDIYDTADLDMPEVTPSQPDVSPPLPSRGPQSSSVPAPGLAPPMISRMNKPSPASSPAGSPAVPRTPFSNKPALKQPIGSPGRPPMAEPPPSPPSSTVSVLELVSRKAVICY